MPHTVGPWYWHRDFRGTLRLMSPKHGNCVVMDFVRRGMQGAQPRFSDRNGDPRGGIMIEADKLNLSGNPDALLITASPDVLDSLVDLLHVIDASTYGEDSLHHHTCPAPDQGKCTCGVYEAMTAARAAVAKTEVP